jgi:hypothetical protein
MTTEPCPICAEWRYISLVKICPICKEPGGLEEVGNLAAEFMRALALPATIVLLDRNAPIDNILGRI